MDSEDQGGAPEGGLRNSVEPRTEKKHGCWWTPALSAVVFLLQLIHSLGGKKILPLIKGPLVGPPHSLFPLPGRAPPALAAHSISGQ